jgi:hypothetical protein
LKLEWPKEVTKNITNVPAAAPPTVSESYKRIKNAKKNKPKNGKVIEI